MEILFNPFVYGLVAFLFWIVVYLSLYMMESSNWGREDRVFGVLWGGTVAAFWPISIPLFLLFVFVKYPLQPLLRRMEKAFEEVWWKFR